MTDKCKHDFERWFLETYRLNIDWFYRCPISMQYGILVDFFDEKGIIIKINYWTKSSYDISLKNGGKNFFSEICGNTRQEVRKQAIEKANEIYNK